jgi:hypothetical protein
MPSTDGKGPFNIFFKWLSSKIFTRNKPARKNMRTALNLKSVGALRGILIPLGIIITHDFFSRNSFIRKLLNKFLNRS